MESANRNVLTRDDTLLGVCQALGEDFGFNPMLLRIVFATTLYFNPAAVIGAYLALGVVVLASRLLVPNPRRGAAPAEEIEARAAPADNDTGAALAKAA